MHARTPSLSRGRVGGGTGAHALTPTVLEPIFMMEEMTVLRFPFRIPWIWKHCRVVARRSFCP